MSCICSKICELLSVIEWQRRGNEPHRKNKNKIVLGGGGGPKKCLEKA